MKLGKKNRVFVLLMLLNLNLNYVYAEVEQASSNEFPATAGTVATENDGFVLEWEDGNWSDFMRQLSDATNFQMDSVDVFGMFNGERDNTIAAHDYHKAAPNKSSANVKEEIAANEQAEQAPEDRDWRLDRKWWQRGAPVL